MNFSFKLLMVFFLAFIESMFFFLPLTVTFLVILVIFEEKERVFILSFMSGLFLDFLQVRMLGTTSLLFLTIILFVFLYKRKFIGRNPFFVSIFVFLSGFASSFLVTKRIEISLAQALLLALLTLIFLLYSSNLFKPSIKPALR